MTHHNKSYHFTDNEKWHLDRIIMEWWDAESNDEKKEIELECYKEFKRMDFHEDFIDYLRDNDADNLANEMEHFLEVYARVPHSHEKRRAA
jgi:DNA-binding GntR family transcriptional regulator